MWGGIPWPTDNDWANSSVSVSRRRPVIHDLSHFNDLPLATVTKILHTHTFVAVQKYLNGLAKRQIGPM